MHVSAVLIVKNEAKTLGRCLQSIHGHVDEIVVVDTSSSDATKDIARQYTDRLAVFPRRQDFAAARQDAFDLASGNWVFWLDTDEVVLNADKICIIHPMDYKYNWIICYTNAFYHVGRQQEALAWTHRALQMCLGETWHRANWDFFHT
jgi:glycosyltransferase involved in cell wall biosynthesis